MPEASVVVKPKPTPFASEDRSRVLSQQLHIANERIAQLNKTTRTADAPKRQHRRETRKQRNAFEEVRRAEAQYQTQLRRVAAQVGHLADLIDAGDPSALHRAERLLKQYAIDITPWAKAVAAGMLADVDMRDRRAWQKLSRLMGAELQYEIQNAPTGARLQELMSEQVKLITSIPLEAAQRVHKFAIENLSTGARFAAISEALQTTHQVAKGRADLIARTEVGRASSVLTQSRAEYVGSPGYIWRTVGDLDVRKIHQKLNGTFHKWTEPPIAGEHGARAHAGAIYNCFPGDTLVDPGNDTLKIIRAFYSGPLVTIFIGNTFFEATPNHPILTIRGWVAADLLKEGDQVVSMATERSNSVMHNIEKRQVTFGEMFKALSASSETTIGFVDNLYGDIVNHKIDVITIDQDLPFNLEAMFFKKIRNEMIANTNGGVFDSRIERGFSEIAETLSAGSFNEFLPVALRSLSHSNEHRITSVTALDPMTIEQLSNRQPATFEFSSECFNTHPREVELYNSSFGKEDSSLTANAWDFKTHATQMDTNIIGMKSDGSSSFLKRLPFAYELRSVLKKTIRNFAGHVYTLETVKGFYSVSQAAVISKNCRCFPEPIIT